MSQNFIVLMMIVVFIIVFVLKIGKYGMFLVVWKNWRNGTMVIRRGDMDGYVYSIGEESSICKCND